MKKMIVKRMKQNRTFKNENDIGEQDEAKQND